MQEKQDASWSAIYIRASPDHPRGGIAMKLENDYIIVRRFPGLRCAAAMHASMPSACSITAAAITVMCYIGVSGGFIQHTCSLMCARAWCRAGCLATAETIRLAMWKATSSSSSLCASQTSGMCAREPFPTVARFEVLKL